MSGPAKKPSHLKALAGTSRPDREPLPPAVPLPDLLDTIPEAPDWMPNPHAVKEWNRATAILLQRGRLTEGCLTMLGHMCAMHGNIIRTMQAGANVTTSTIDVMRKIANDIGLTGDDTKTDGDGPKKNKFSNNGRRRT